MKLLTSVASVIALCPIGPAVECTYAAAHHEYRFQTLDVPAALGAETSAFGINNLGVIVGNFVTVDGNFDGFLFKRGSFTDIAVPGASPDDRGALEAVNDAGLAVGDFIDPNSGIQHMFVRQPRGEISVLADAASGALLTEGRGINNRGIIVGVYHDAEDNRHGFILHDGVYNRYDYPGALRTLLTGIDDRGQIIGFWVDTNRNRHGFLLRDGVTTAIAVPGAVKTTPAGINNRGQIVGYYDDANGITHGFMLALGEYTVFDFPGAANTALLGINDHGIIVGTYDDFSHGLVATPDQ